jgi:hypothetical protein
MKTFIIAGSLLLFAATAQAGLLKGPPQIEAVRQTNAETNSVSVARPALRPAARPLVKKVKPRHKQRRRSDDDDFDRDDD